MNSKRLLLLTGLSVCILACGVFTAAQAATETRGIVQNLMPPTLTRSCVVFTLNGVAEADPAIPGNPWFAIASTHPGFDKLYSMLQTMKQLTMELWVSQPYEVKPQPTLIVQTTGNSICGGYAEVSYAYWTS